MCVFADRSKERAPYNLISNQIAMSGWNSPSSQRRTHVHTHAHTHAHTHTLLYIELDSI